MPPLAGRLTTRSKSHACRGVRANVVSRRHQMELADFHPLGKPASGVMP